MSELHNACHVGNLTEVEKLLKTLTMDDVNRKDSNGNTPLHVACLQGHNAVAKALLKYPAVRSIKNKAGKNAMDLIKNDEDLISKFERMGEKKSSNRYVDDANEADDQVASDKTSEFYFACRSGDIETAKRILLTLDLKDIDRIESNGSTALHAACYHGHVEIVRILLQADASRSVKNIHGCIPYEEASSDQIKELFRRIPGKNRFVSDSGRIDWILVTPYVRETAAGKLHALKFYRNSKLGELAQRVKSYYLATELKDINGLDQIMYFFQRAIAEGDPAYIIKAYTAETGFYSRLNRDLAGGSTSGDQERQFIVGIIIHNPAFEKYTFIGETYRGMKMTDEDLKYYVVGSSIMTKSFLSTTRDKHMANAFAEGAGVRSNNNGDVLKFPAFCKYIIKNKRTALAIEDIAEYPQEREVLIMPYAVFVVKAVELANKSESATALTYITLEECEPFAQKLCAIM